MLAIDKRGNKLLEVIKCAETDAANYQPLPLSLVIVRNAGAFMLLKNKYRNEWELPGGMIEQGETPRDCAVRECREESGYDVSELRFCGVAKFQLVADYFGGERVEYAAIYACEVAERCEFKENDEMSGLQWHTPGDALADASELDLKLLEYYFPKYPIEVRPMTLDDCEDVTKVYEGEPGWWHEVDMCREVTQKRLEHGWHITVAERGGGITAHAEWIIDRDKDGEYLYLDELQVIKSAQQSGIGRAVVADGIAFAEKSGIKRVAVIPEQDTGSEAFYAKCGFVKTDKILSAEIAAGSDELRGGFTAVDKVPKSVLDTKRLVFGVMAFSPLHMWVIENDKISFDKYISDKFRFDNGDYVQFRHASDKKTASVLLWSSEPNRESIATILSCAAYAGLETVEFVFLAEYAHLFDGFGAKAEQSGIIMERRV